MEFRHQRAIPALDARRRPVATRIHRPERGENTAVPERTWPHRIRPPSQLRESAFLSRCGPCCFCVDHHFHSRRPLECNPDTVARVALLLAESPWNQCGEARDHAGACAMRYSIAPDSAPAAQVTWFSLVKGGPSSVRRYTFSNPAREVSGLLGGAPAATGKRGTNRRSRDSQSRSSRDTGTACPGSPALTPEPLRHGGGILLDGRGRDHRATGVGVVWSTQRDDGNCPKNFPPATARPADWAGADHKVMAALRMVCADIPLGCRVRPNSGGRERHRVLVRPYLFERRVEGADRLAELLQQRILGPKLRTVGIESAQLAKKTWRRCRARRARS